MTVRLCACGCGQVTPIAPNTRPERGWVKGEQVEYFPHHKKNRWPVSDGVTKQCRGCRKILPVSEFWKNTTEMRDGLQIYCKPCMTGRIYSYRTTANGRVSMIRAATKQRFKRYKMTQAEYDQLCRAQDWRCALCRKPETRTFKGKPTLLAIDHCHDTGRVRGLLCCACNQSLGKFNHDPALLRRAAMYIERLI